jgi:hypothetical protein
MARMNGTALAKREPIKVKVKRKQSERTPKRFIDFHAYNEDFQAVLLSAIGFSTKAIAARLMLTEGQVTYRIFKAERKRSNGTPTQRMAYRRGDSEIANMLANTVSVKQNAVYRSVNQTLDDRGLYDPIKPRGVMNDDKSLLKRR